MFTGIIEETGTIRHISRESNSARLSVAAARVLEGTSEGDSIAVNGVCLTVTSLFRDGFTADAMPETLARSTLGGLKSGDRVLILESCTHHVTCEDIGRVKIPGKLRSYLAKKNNDADFVLEFDFVAGTDEIPHKNYGLAIQCGGCMVTKRELVNRVGSLVERNIPVTNYGMAIAFLSGIMERVCYEPHK